ncbi:MAG: addiction module protein [Actinomycetota bacterium]|nr:addiction module protein [Actinomycetota bacterium]
MTSETETILREALSLRDEDRADLAAQLLASLDSPAVEDPATIDAVWALELERRAARVLSGEAATEDWATARARVADRLKE